MPFVFVHGVNVRTAEDDPENDRNSYEKEQAARNRLIKSYLLKPLGASIPGADKMEIVSPYWGKYGAKFRWGLATVPRTRFIDHYGGDDEAPPLADFELTEMLLRASTQPENDLGRKPAPTLRNAAITDPVGFLQTVLAPVLNAEWRLLREEDDQTESGRMEAELLMAAGDVATDGNVMSDVAAAGTDDEVADLLQHALSERLRVRVREGRGEIPVRIDEYGEGSLSQAFDRIGDLFLRIRDKPGRLGTLPLLEHFRQDLHLNLARFVGDIFQYLRQREGSVGPGPIVKEVLGAIERATRSAPEGEPLIIMTHSMGGNILYDIITHYAVTLRVDAWISVAAQVGQLEEMKFFLESDPHIEGPMKVDGLRPRVRYWLNIYDPADPFAFLAEPVFSDAEDLLFKTSSSVKASHGAYFMRLGFYELVAQRLEAALRRQSPI
jgi:hypothetical protein